MMDLEHFMDAVVVLLPKLSTVLPNRHTDTPEGPSLASVLKPMHAKNFTIDDAVSFCLCFGELTPDLDEDVALRRMATIAMKYADSV